jgi:hypothetical protein
MTRTLARLSTGALLTAVVGLTACGGSSSSSTTASSAAAGGDKASAVTFRQCLTDHGVSPRSGAPGGGPPPSSATPPSGGPRDDPAFRKALQACAKYRPQGQGRFGQGYGQGQGQGANPQVFAAYLSCLEAKGLKIDTSQGFRALGALDRSDPKVASALNACQSKLPQGPRPAPAPAAGAPSPS